MSFRSLRRISLLTAAAVVRATNDFPGRWRLAQWALREVRAVGPGMGPRVIRTRHGFVMRCDPGDWVGQHILATGTWEDMTTAVIQTCVSPGATVVDVGANIGFYTLLLSQLVTNSGRVLAFEPMPVGLERLRTNLRLNAVRNVDVREQAVAATNGTARFFLGPPEHTSISSLHRIEDAEAINVDCTTLDAALGGYPRVDFLKVDVEGAEADVLNGAIETLKRGVPYIIGEVSSSDWPPRLIALGYEMFLIMWNGLRRVEDPHAPGLPTQYNALFTTQGPPAGVPMLVAAF
jgi:FkbM family methyltransferase